MRALAALVVVVVLGLLSYAAAGASAQAQAAQAGITVGEKLTLAFDPDRVGYSCTVIEVRGDFIGCRPVTDNIGRPNIERWYNLRLVTRLERPAP
jgi:hypothetical protein